MSSKMVTVIGKFHTKTESAIKITVLNKNKLLPAKTVWFPLSRISTVKQLSKKDGDYMVKFDCPSWLLKKIDIKTSWLKELYTPEQKKKIQHFITIVDEILVNRIPKIETKYKIDKQSIEHIKDIRNYLERELNNQYPTTYIKDINIQYNRALSIFKRMSINKNVI